MKKLFGFIVAAFLLLATPVYADHQPVEEFLATAVVGSIAVDVRDEGVEEVFAVLTPIFGPPPAQFVSRVDNIILVLSPNAANGLFVFVTEQGTVLTAIPVPTGVAASILDGLHSRELVDEPRPVGVELPVRPS